MSSVLGCPQTQPALDAGLPPDEIVSRRVWQIIASLCPQGHHPERRTAQRFPYPKLLYLTGVAENGITPRDDSIAVVGKHLSERGLGFYYQQPLPNRRMIASLEGPEADWYGFLIDITWCRFTEHGWYDSGGRFLMAVPSPISARRR